MKLGKDIESYNLFIDMRPLYVGTDNSDHVLTNVIKRGEKLDLSSPTGFHDVKLVEQWKNFTDDVKDKDITNLSELCHNLVYQLEYVIRESWNSNVPHVIYMSGGKDSRILAYILKRLSLQEGNDWLGEVKFYCMEELPNKISQNATSDIFKTVLSDLGWSKLGIIHNPTRIGKEDYMDFDCRMHPNAFTSFDCLTYSSLTHDPIQLKNWSVIMGSMGGEGLEYPSRNGFTNNRWVDICRYIPSFGYSFASTYQTFESVIFPFLSKSYLQTLFRANGRLFVKDQIRDYILTNIFNDKRPTYVGHNYNFRISNYRSKYLEELWNKSVFRLQYHVTIDTSILRNHFYDKKNANSKLFGLAMAYDMKFGEKI